MTYCLAADLYLYGLPRGALASPGRLVDSVSVSGDTFELDAHGFETDAELQFRTAGGGGLPSPVAEGTSYYAIPSSDWAFQIAASEGGAAINLTTTGTTFLVLAPMPVTAAIAKASRMIDDMLPAHVIPLEDPVADIIRMTTAELAAADLLARTGGQSVSLTTIYDAARKRVERWARNAPVRGENAPPTAQRSARTSTTTASPWRTYGGIA